MVVLLLNRRFFSDYRGSLIKTFHEPTFGQCGLETDFIEDYYSISNKNVLRGLHFQVPPHEHTKIVYCVCGKVFDVVLDIRKGSPTFGKFETFIINDENAHMIYISPGLAHGFYTLSDKAIMMYRVSTVYSPDSDSGILWNSANISWPCDEPILHSEIKNFKH